MTGRARGEDVLEEQDHQVRHDGDRQCGSQERDGAGIGADEQRGDQQRRRTRSDGLRDEIHGG
jgi:hypothetical protein